MGPFQRFRVALGTLKGAGPSDYKPWGNKAQTQRGRLHADGQLSKGGEISKAVARGRPVFRPAETALLKPRRASKTKAPAGSRVE